MLNTFHEILGSNPSNTPAEIKGIWRKLCTKCHPDVTGGESSEFIRITHAYRMLTDPEYRNKQKQIPEAKNLNFKVQAFIDFSEGFFGTTLLISYNRVVVNAAHEPIRKLKDLEPIVLKIEIPPGTKNYAKEMPDLGLKMGEKTGNAQVMVIAKPHPKFSLSGKDITSKEEVPLDIMLKGGVIQIPTMYGIKPLTIKPGTPPEEVLCIKNCGVNEVGDHYVSIMPVFPSVEDLKSSSWSEFNIDWDVEEEEDRFIIDFESIVGVDFDK